MNKVGRGLKWAGREHRYEKLTNTVLLVGCGIVLFTSKVGIYPGDYAIFFLFAGTLIHLVARLGHFMEQHYLKASRPWNN